MGKTLQIKTFTAVGAVLFLALSIGVLFNKPAHAFDDTASPIMLNRTAIAMGSVDKAENIFYDKDTSNDNYVWQNTTNGCYSDITREDAPSDPETGTGGGYEWILRSSTKLPDDSCSPEKTTTLPTPKNYPDREYVVFYRDKTDVVHSVKADLQLDFENTKLSARGNVDAIYIQKGVDPYSCPSLIVDQKSPDGWAYVMMERSDSAEKASDEYDGLIKDLGRAGYFGSTDVSSFNDVCKAAGDDDGEGNLSKIGLPESYFDAGNEKDNYEEVSFGYPGESIGSVDIHSMLGADAAGMALAGPLKGGFVESGELDSGGNEDGDIGPVCSAGALGWVLCPLSEAIVSATESIAGILEELLTFQPLTNSAQGDAIRSIWGTLLGVANAGLVVAFLVIVFSQATSIGLSSYGIKKLLPRVIAAAILMNLSFYLCAAAVDISNILGVSIKSIVGAGIEQVTASSNNPDLYTGAGGMQWIAVIVAALLAAAIAVATGAIFLLLPVLVAGLMAVFTALIIIAARQVLITLLIIVAPLAILAWILPNTEQWFTKWRKLFTLLLLMFPMVMAIFYGSVLVSNVILAAAGNSGSGLNDFTIKLLAFLVLIVPLFSLPFVIKSVGGIMDRLGVIVNNRNKGVVDRTRKKSQEMYNRGSYARGRTIRQQAKAEYRNKKFASRLSAAEGARTLGEAISNKERELGRSLTASETAGVTAQWSNARTARRLAGGMAGVRSDLAANARRGDNRLTGALLNNAAGQRVTGSPIVQAQAGALVRAAQAQEAKEFNERVSTILTSYERGGEAGADTKARGHLEQQWHEAINTGNQEQAAAVISRLTNLGGGGRDRVAKLVERTTVGDQKMRDAITKSVSQDNYGSLVGKRGDLAKGGYDSAGVWSPAGNIAKVSSEQLATQDKQALKLHFADIPQVEAARIVNDPELRSKVTGAEELAILEAAANGGQNPYPPTANDMA